MIGTKFKNYLITEFLGHGGFGEVYKCEHTETNEVYALKVLTKYEGDSVRRFAREVRLMKVIQHRNVVSIVDDEIVNLPFFFVMPLAKESLEASIDRLRDDHELALNIFLKVCNGIEAIHLSGMFHRDIKPENVLILPDDEILVSDLGLGMFEQRDSTLLTSSNVAMGTEGYIPPEFMIVGGTKNADQRSDIYQLGKMLCRMLTGDLVILSNDNSLSSALVYIINKATKDNPKDRFQNVSELMNAVNFYKASLQIDLNTTYESNILDSIKLFNKNKNDKYSNIILLQNLFALKEDEMKFFEFFDRIPLELIRQLINDCKTEFNQVFYVYTEKIFNYITSNYLSFQYAETIAELMRVIYQTSSDICVKENALKNNLISSVHYNRYNAMAIFDELLLLIKDDEEAKVIASMLIEEKESFRDRIETLSYENLHPRFQEVINFINEEEKERHFDPFTIL